MRERRDPAGLEGDRIDAVRIAALVERRERHAVVDDDVGTRGILHPRARAPSVTLRERRLLEDPGPEGVPGFELGGEPRGANEAVSVVRLAALEADRVQHAVAVEGVIATADGVEEWVFRVAKVDALEVFGDLAGDHVQIVSVDLGRVGRPRCGPVRMRIVLRELRFVTLDDLDAHLRS